MKTLLQVNIWDRQTGKTSFITKDAKFFLERFSGASIVCISSTLDQMTLLKRAFEDKNINAEFYTWKMFERLRGKKFPKFTAFYFDEADYLPVSFQELNDFLSPYNPYKMVLSGTPLQSQSLLIQAATAIHDFKV